MTTQVKIIPISTESARESRSVLGPLAEVTIIEVAAVVRLEAAAAESYAVAVVSDGVGDVLIGALAGVNMNVFAAVVTALPLEWAAGQRE